MWRAQTGINYLAARAVELGRQAEMEILVADWGSLDPVHKNIQLSQAAAQMTSFLVISPEIAAKCNQDSPFAEVFPINAAVRRASGHYVARIDQDTLVTGDFLRIFFAHLDSRAQSTLVADDEALMFSARRQVPYTYVKNEHSLPAIEDYIERWGKHSAPEESTPFYGSPVGIILAHRTIWHEARGYDETLIYYWYMDLDFAKRVGLKYELRNIGKAFGYDIFHLEHFPLWRWRGNHRKLNPEKVRLEAARKVAVNDSTWGLADQTLPLIQIDAASSIAVGSPHRTAQIHRRLHWQAGAWTLLHRIRIRLAKVVRRWKPR